MKVPFYLAIAITTMALLATPSPVCADDSAKQGAAEKEQVEKLQGKWVGGESGREFAGDCTMTISGNSIHLKAANPGEWYKGTFTLPGGTEPKQLVATITECPFAEAVGKKSYSIYKIERGTITLVGHKPGDTTPPATLEGDGTSRTFVLKKVEASSSGAPSN